MTTKAFFDKPEDTEKVAERLEVSQDCNHSLTANSAKEVRIAASESGVSTKSYSIADVEDNKPQ